MRTGKLSNGLTYYIRHNKLPENRADFYIAQKVGSILEEENQRGLAHFLEHIAFNGSKNFPSTSLRDYLEKNGVKFGENLNAYTSVDETVYNICNVPARQGLMDSCLLILHDWSSFLTLEDAEIDKERGVIHEEWRTRNNAQMRMFEKALPEIYGADRYGHRFPIGLMSVVDNFKYKELRDYYHKWYRPDLQGIIVVGDFDVDSMENRIKTIFADIPAPKNPAERVYYSVSDNKEPVVSVVSDKEATSTSFIIFHKYETTPDSLKNDMNYMTFLFLRNIMDMMINARYQEIVQKPDAPFTYAAADNGEFFLSKTKDAYDTYAACKEGKIDEALTLITQETKRMKQYGFTQTEYDRAKADYLKQIENAYNERDKGKNNEYVREYVSTFLDNEPTTGIEFFYQFNNAIADRLPLETVELISGLFSMDTNTVILLMMPEKEGLDIPTKEHIINVYTKALADSVSLYVDKVVDTKLIKKLPKAGKVKKKEPYAFGAVEWTLSNGIKVIFKETDYKQNQILLKAQSFGGESLLDEKDMPTINLLNDLINLSGVGEFSKTDLTKALAGKKADLRPSLSLRAEELNGSCAPKDLETMLQLAYLYLTEPRIDREAYEAYLSRKRTELQNAETNPFTTLVDTINSTLYNKHPRRLRLKYEMLDRVNYDRAMQMYRERFMNADQFTFTFVGNINPDSVQPLVEKYLGALPKEKAKETFRDVKLYPAKGIKENVFARPMETAKTTAFVYYNGSCDYTLKNSILLDILYQCLNIVYTEKVREEEGGTYGVRVRGDVAKYPYPMFNMQIMFDTDPAIVDKLLKIVYAEIDGVIADGVRPEDFAKVKEFMQKKIKESKAENGYWLGALEELGFTSLDLATDYETTLNAVTAEDVRAFAAQIFGQKNRVEVVMNPAEKYNIINQ
ncbi:peptidase M16 [Bacteroidia bacterium]|nr:peptidase M16 [Bacteroidia bacterium]